MGAVGRLERVVTGPPSGPARRAGTSCPVSSGRLRLDLRHEAAATLDRPSLAALLAGILWMTFGPVVLGVPQGLGLIFIGLACLALGVYGAGWRVLHGYRLSHDPRRR